MQQASSWLPYWPVIVVVAGWLVSAGFVLAKLDGFKNELQELKLFTAARLDSTVKKDVLAETLAGLKSDIAHVRDLLERSSRDWRGVHHGGKE